MTTVFEQLLLEIRGMSIQFACLYKMQHIEETELCKQINILENLTDDLSIYPFLSELLTEHKTRLEIIGKDRLKGVIKGKLD